MFPNREIIAAGVWASGLASWGLYGTFAPASSFWGKVISGAADRTRPVVSLTFDDGPTPGSTERVLDLLAKLNTPATFFVIGQNAEQWPQLLRRMDAEGHIVAGHTFDHRHFGLFRGWGYWQRQVERSNRLIEEIIGNSVRTPLHPAKVILQGLRRVAARPARR